MASCTKYSKKNNQPYPESPQPNRKNTTTKQISLKKAKRADNQEKFDAKTKRSRKILSLRTTNLLATT
jgi:hypothetical protein